MSLQIAGNAHRGTAHPRLLNQPGAVPAAGLHKNPAVRTPPAAVLRCRDLTHRAGDQPLVESVSFDIDAGEAYGLFGPDAVARSAVVAMVCGLLDAGTGSVHLLGRPIAELDQATLSAMVGYVAQSAVVLTSGTIGENLAIWARIGGLPEAEHQIRIAEALAQVGTTTRRDEPVSRCTGGTLRELSLAVALLRRPRLLVLDEPTRGLEPRGRARLVATLAGLRANGTALLYSGCTPAEVPELCDPIGRLEDGRLTTTSRPQLGVSCRPDSVPPSDN